MHRGLPFSPLANCVRAPLAAGRVRLESIRAHSRQGTWSEVWAAAWALARAVSSAWASLAAWPVWEAWAATPGGLDGRLRWRLGRLGCQTLRRLWRRLLGRHGPLAAHAACAALAMKALSSNSGALGRSVAARRMQLAMRSAQGAGGHVRGDVGGGLSEADRPHRGEHVIEGTWRLGRCERLGLLARHGRLWRLLGLGQLARATCGLVGLAIRALDDPCRSGGLFDSYGGRSGLGNGLGGGSVGSLSPQT